MSEHCYPHCAGYTEPTTSRDAAVAVEASGRAESLRRRVKDCLGVNGAGAERGYWRAGMTADEIAAELGESPFSIRPRLSELRKRGDIEPTGERRISSNGKLSHVWRLVAMRRAA